MCVTQQGGNEMHTEGDGGRTAGEFFFSFKTFSKNGCYLGYHLKK